MTRRLERLGPRTKEMIIALFWQLVRTSPYYRDPLRSLARRIRIENALLSNESMRRLLLTKNEPKYRAVSDSPPCETGAAGDIELHVLCCEADVLRGMWALKSFYRYSSLCPRLYVHNDGTMSAESIAGFTAHFPG